MMAGIVLSARAGGSREQGAKKETGSGYALALALAVLCGLLAPMINYSFVFGQQIAAHAVQLGISPIRAAYTVWPVTLAGGLLPNLAYCIYLLSKKKTWALFLGPVASRCRIRRADGRPLDGRIGDLRRRLGLPRRTRHLSRLGPHPDFVHHDRKYRRPARR